MADLDETNDVGWLIGILVVLGLLWLGLGGPNRERSQEGPLTVYEVGGDEQIRTRGEGTGTSEYTKKIILDAASARSSSRENEYLRITAHRNNEGSVNITGWKVISPLTNTTAFIPKGAYLPRLGGINTTRDILLSPGESAILASGSSAIGASFKINLCTGYFEQFQDLRPSLPQECPMLENENLAAHGISIQNLGGDDYDACTDFIEGISRCELASTANPPFPECRKVRFEDDPPDECFGFDLCRSFINKYGNYNGCVLLHQNDSDFYKGEWRIFLGAKDELWRRDKEVIMLMDQSGNVVDVVSY